MAFSKMAGLLVTPSRPSFSTIAASSPEVIRPRRMLSYQMDWPNFCTSSSGLAIEARSSRVSGRGRLGLGICAEAGGDQSGASPQIDHLESPIVAADHHRRPGLRLLAL